MATGSGKLIGVSIVGVALVAAGLWMNSERSKLAAEKARLAETEARLAQEGGPAARKLEAATTRAEAETTALNDAISASERLADAQRKRVLLTSRLLEAFVAANQAKVAMAEARQMNDAWPRDNREAGLPAPDDYRSERIYSLYDSPAARSASFFLTPDGPQNP